MVLSGPLQDAVMEENVQKMKEQFTAAHNVSKDGRIQMKEVPFMTVTFLTVPPWAIIFSEG